MRKRREMLAETVLFKLIKDDNRSSALLELIDITIPSRILRILNILKLRQYRANYELFNLF